MNERLVADELQGLDQRVNDALQILGSAERDQYDAGETILYGRAVFERFSSLLRQKFSQESGSIRRRAVVSLTFPQNRGESHNPDDWKETKDFQVLPEYFRKLQGEKVICVIEDLRPLAFRLFVLSGDRELMRFWQDFSPGFNIPPLISWDFICNQGDCWDARLAPLVGLKKQSPLKQLEHALRLLQLINKRGQVDESTRETSYTFNCLQPLPAFS